jgi:hypothetical protein
MNKNKIEEKYKILEYNDYSTIEPVNSKYDYCIFFFAGFNENASKYLYLFKNFFENLQNDLLPVFKVVIPLLPKYPIEDYPKRWIMHPENYKEIFAWYSYEIITVPEGVTIKILPNKEKDEHIISLVNKEIKKFGGDTERVIFSGFSMGGKYLLNLLNVMKIKTKFNFICKSIAIPYEFPSFPSNNQITTNFKKNIFYYYFSVYDKVILFERVISSISVLKENFVKENVHIKFDLSKKHLVDANCLNYLENILKKNFLNSAKF